MKEHPILMSTTMIQAYMAGRKTMTRRTSSRWERASKGDGLWFRETYWEVGRWERKYPEDDEYSHWEKFGRVIHYAADGNPEVNGENDWSITEKHGRNGFIPYRRSWIWRKKPSIFLPRKEARFTPPILEIRKERLQDITIEDIRAEGLQMPKEFIGIGDNGPIENPVWDNRDPWDFWAELWDSINGHKLGQSWTDNPEVYVISFPRYEA